MTAQAIFHCSDCGLDKPVQTDGGTGYAVLTASDGAPKVCYACCAIRDAGYMRQSRNGNTLPLYLSRKSVHKPNDGCWEVSNWCGTLRFPVQRITEGSHNIARTRTDVWFYFEGFIWRGVQYGEMTQIVHCKRTSERVAA
jgi:hypothetical protein